MARALSTKEHLDKHDRQIAAIRDLIREGMQLVIETRKDIRTLAAMQKTTAAAQARTEASLKAFIETMRPGGGNGHTKRNVD